MNIVSGYVYGWIAGTFYVITRREGWVPSDYVALALGIAWACALYCGAVWIYGLTGPKKPGKGRR